MTSKAKFKSDAFEAIYSAAQGLHRAGTIDKATMRDFDESCLVVPVEIAPEEIKRDDVVRPERLGVAGTTRDTGHHSRFAPRSSFWPPRHAALAPIALAAASRFIGLSPCPRALGAPEGASADVARRERAGCRSRCTVCGFDAR